MHVNITIRGYRETEKTHVDYVENKLRSFLDSLADDLLMIIGYDEVEEDEDYFDFNFHKHLYPAEEGERFYVG